MVIEDQDPKTAGERAARDVASLLKSRTSLIVIQTAEEERAERLVADAAESAGYSPRAWDMADGETTRAGTEIGTGRASANPAPEDSLFPVMRDTKDRIVWILRDLPLLWGNATVNRGLRSLARRFAISPRTEARAIVVITPRTDLPPELAACATIVEWPRPDRAEIRGILEAGLAVLPDSIRESARPKNGDMERAIDAAVGLTEGEAAACFKRSLVERRAIVPEIVASEKKRAIKAARGLEWYDALPGGLTMVGGLEILKGWIKERALAFSAAARAYGLPAPKGILLLGPPGTGKSLSAKAIATALGVPLLRFDLGGSRSKYVGESEGNLRATLKIVESIAPCVLWVDEIEKMLAGASEGAADGGVSADALGTLLGWMQEKAGEVFIVATANDVSRLPPELLRKGRFDEIFFIDLPTRTERAAIVAAALKAHKRTETVDAGEIAGRTEGFTGAEIAALVPDAMFRAFADGARKITTEDLATCAGATVPLAKTSDKVGKLREWAKGRTRPASAPEGESANQGRGGLDL